MARFLPWVLAVVFASISVAECGALQLAGSQVVSLEAERHRLTEAVATMGVARRISAARQACAARPDLCVQSDYGP
jgi:hypothetical protein